MLVLRTGIDGYSGSVMAPVLAGRGHDVVGLDFCLAEHPDAKQRHYLNLFKLGEVPLYSFYPPYHRSHFEVPNTMARVGLSGDSAGQATGGPWVEVCAVAKRGLCSGDSLDAYGGYLTYREAANSDERRRHRYLPQGLVEGSRLLHDVARDEVLTYDDVELPVGRVADRLYAEQLAMPAASASTVPRAGTAEHLAGAAAPLSWQ